MVGGKYRYIGNLRKKTGCGVFLCCVLHACLALYLDMSAPAELPHLEREVFYKGPVPALARCFFGAICVTITGFQTEAEGYRGCLDGFQTASGAAAIPFAVSP